MNKLPGLFVIISIVCTGCGYTETVAGSAAVGGVGGAALGAGIGALVGHETYHGDVGESAAVGAGIGLGAGIVLGAAIKTIHDRNIIENNQYAIDENKNMIFNNERQIESERNALDAELGHTDVNSQLVEVKQYIGPRLGNYYRP